MKIIVCGVDGSPTALEAARRASALANETGATLHLVTAVTKRASGSVSGGGERWALDDLTQAEQLLADVASRLAPQCNVSQSVLRDEPADAVISEAERLSADVIVVGNRRIKGAARLFGAVATDILRKAPCDVLVARTT